MDSRSGRFPFCVSRTTPLNPSGLTASSSRLYGRETSLTSDRFPRASSTFKTERHQPPSHVPGYSSRDYSSYDSGLSNWRSPSSLTSTNRSYDRLLTGSSYSSRSKQTDSEDRLGMRSGLLNVNDDGDSKRAKLTYANRGLYTRTTPDSGSNYSSSALRSGGGLSDSYEPSWTSSRLITRSSSPASKPLLSRREVETKTESSYSGLAERKFRNPERTSSLYQSERVTSTYAQGARPKESIYSSSRRESSRSSHLSPLSSSSSSTSSSPTPYRSTALTRDFSSRSPSTLSGSSGLRSSQGQTRNLSCPPWYSLNRPEPPAPPRPAPEDAEPEDHRSTRRLLSRLFSRHTSLESSSRSSSPSLGPEYVESDARTRNPEMGATSGWNRKPDLSEGYQGLPHSSLLSPREPEATRSTDSTDEVSRSPASRTSSLRARCPPLLSRLRRHAMNESTHASAGRQDGYGLPQPKEEDTSKASSEEEDDEEEEEEEEGAVGLDVFQNRRPYIPAAELSGVVEAALQFQPRIRVGSLENPPTSDKPQSSVDQEKLQKIKERLLLEDSDEDEGDLCRICQMGQESASNPLIQPCCCTGSLQYVHQECIKRWLCCKISSGTALDLITTCELCKEKLRLEMDNFNVQELHRTHVQSEYDNFISSGLYLVVLLHFFEQRFTDVLGAVDAAGLFNLVRILHDHVESLESSRGDTDEAEDSRPSIDFSDLDDDLEDY
ncbi:E3 ubiquitin-protein ligase MARCH7 [Synchiropus splendidus]|uniref:E3 ubiquitin-protein ligase MARCH7 n=1 Tax=Synchiropus splendidus TaxID=270530 RepID=UPI00237ED714|nr:E3 ubiquitin-protein ligase MARCH7 [Synchiropus splendidus]XP_053722722.1 E3 ubiquitin-protein ligase MARCH7 [Synchiropus splendidus]